MNPITTRSLIGPLAALGILFAASTALAGDDGARAGNTPKERLARGEVVISTKKVAGSDIPSMKAMAVIDAPAERLWKIVDDCANYKKTMPRIVASEEVSRKGNKVRCKTTLEMPFPLDNLTATTEATLTVQPGKQFKRAWTLVEGDFKRNTGSWTLLPYEDGKKTLAIYEVHAEPNIAVPDAIQKAAQRKSVPQLFERLRKQVEEK